MFQLGNEDVFSGKGDYSADVVHDFRAELHTQRQADLHACTYMKTHIHDIHAHTHVFTDIHTQTYMHNYIYACMYACMNA